MPFKNQPPFGNPVSGSDDLRTWEFTVEQSGTTSCTKEKVCKVAFSTGEHTNIRMHTILGRC